VVVAINAGGGLTLRGRELPVGTIVRDQKGRFTGRVVKVFGPVAHPYISVRPRHLPSPEELISMVGETVVVKEG
jgi:rRNA processing protein Gar1